MTDELVTITQAASELKISRQAIWKAIKDERLPAENIGGIWLILRSEVEKYEPRRKAGESDD